MVNLLDAKLVQPNPDFFSYTISKFGLAGMTELAARVLASRGIRVCGIAPGITLLSGPQSRDNFEEVHRMNALKRGVTVALPGESARDPYPRERLVDGEEVTIAERIAPGIIAGHAVTHELPDRHRTGGRTSG